MPSALQLQSVKLRICWSSLMSATIGKKRRRTSSTSETPSPDSTSSSTPVLRLAYFQSVVPAAIPTTVQNHFTYPTLNQSPHSEKNCCHFPTGKYNTVEISLTQLGKRLLDSVLTSSIHFCHREHLWWMSGLPVHARAMGLPLDKLAAAKAQFAEMEEISIIRRSNSP